MLLHTQRMRSRRAESCIVCWERCTSSEASTIVRSVTGLEEVEAWLLLFANYSRRTLGLILRVLRGCMYPKPAKDVSQLGDQAARGEVESHDV